MGRSDRTVWVGGWTTSNDVYHTDPECPKLERSRNPQPRTLEEVSDRRECGSCAREGELGGGPSSLHDKLLNDLGPDDVGGGKA